MKNSEQTADFALVTSSSLSLTGDPSVAAEMNKRKIKEELEKKRTYERTHSSHRHSVGNSSEQH